MVSKVFVYGTLRSDGRNKSVLPFPRVPATVHGLAVYDTDGGYPAAILSPNSDTVGEVVSLPESQLDYWFDLLDRFEMVPPHAPVGHGYERVCMSTSDGEQVWVYIAPEGGVLRDTITK